MPSVSFIVLKHIEVENFKSRTIIGANRLIFKLSVIYYLIILPIASNVSDDRDQ